MDRIVPVPSALVANMKRINSIPSVFVRHRRVDRSTPAQVASSASEVASKAQITFAMLSDPEAALAVADDIAKGGLTRFDPQKLLFDRDRPATCWVV